MTRTLPWLKGQGQSSVKTVRAPAAKRQRSVDQESDSDALPTTANRSIRRRRALARLERTPSTSPPPEPPTEELMREGLDRDDIYIMVEDEFHAVAKQFTQQLHHAEYVRLKNFARSRNSTTVTSISRPIDLVTVMREDTKRKKNSESKAAKQKIALAQLYGQAATNWPKTGSEEDSDDDFRKDEDPWAGTTLQGLMSSPSRKESSLTGLQGVFSGTRAAAGFPKPEAGTSQRNYHDIDAKLVSGKEPPTHLRDDFPGVKDDGIALHDDDDLDAPVTEIRRVARTTQSTISEGRATEPRAAVSVPKAKAASRYTSRLPSSSTHPQGALLRSRHNPTDKTSPHKRTKLPSTPDIFKSFSAPSDQRPQTSNRFMKRKADLDARRAKEPPEPKGSINEIPIFLF